MTDLRRFLKLIPIVVVSVLVLAGSGLIRGLATPEKSFSLPRVAVEAELARDGSMHVVEHITYDFHGPFSYGTRPIPPGAYEIADARVTENGQELTSVGAPYNLQWFFSARDEQRTFDVEYTVRPGATVAPDVGEVYWKWVGDAHPTIDAQQWKDLTGASRKFTIPIAEYFDAEKLTLRVGEIRRKR